MVLKGYIIPIFFSFKDEKIPSHMNIFFLHVLFLYYIREKMRVKKFFSYETESFYL